MFFKYFILVLFLTSFDPGHTVIQLYEPQTPRSNSSPFNLRNSKQQEFKTIVTFEMLLVLQKWHPCVVGHLNSHNDILRGKIISYTSHPYLTYSCQIWCVSNGMKYWKTWSHVGFLMVPMHYFCSKGTMLRSSTSENEIAHPMKARIHGDCRIPEPIIWWPSECDSMESHTLSHTLSVTKLA